MENVNSKVNLPPYISLVKFVKLVELISTRNFTTLTNDDLKGYGFIESDSYAGISALRFLGLVDDSSNSTSLIKKFHLQGEARKKAIQEILQIAYKPLFSRIADPYQISSEELKNEFTTLYGLSPRVVQGAVPIFVWLSEQAGLKESETKIRKENKTKVRTSKIVTQSSQHRVASKKDADGQFVFDFPGGISLILPRSEVVSDAIANGELKEVRTAISEFVKKFVTISEDEKTN